MDESQPFKHGILDTLESQTQPNHGLFLANRGQTSKQNIPNFGSLLLANGNDGVQGPVASIP